MAQTFRSPKIPSSLLLLAGLAAPGFFIRTVSKFLRSVTGKIIAEDSKLLHLDTTLWHKYDISWTATGVQFHIDNEPVFQSSISPIGPLGLVIWIDNQYAAWRPNGEIMMGTIGSANTNWLEINQIEIRTGH